MSTSDGARSRGLQLGAGLLLLINALDVTTSLIPYWIDTKYQVPPRSAWEWLGQLALLGVAVLWLGRLAPRIARALLALPIPRAPLMVCGAFVAVELVHVALRYERYPFSPVAMFSDAQVDAPQTWRQPALLLEGPNGSDWFSFQREGDRSFARYFSDLDYKGSAALRMYRDTPAVQALVAREVARHGLPPPKPVYVEYRTSDGQVVSIEPRTPEASFMDEQAARGSEP